MNPQRYPARSLRQDGSRAGIGFVLTAGLAVLARGAPIMMAILGLIALLFLAFGIRTWRRYRTVIELIDDGISTSGGSCVSFSWQELTGLKLRYYATKRDRTGGWMQLGLAAGRKRLSIESSLDGFIEIVRRAAAVADAQGLALDRATRNNLRALGVSQTTGPT